MTISLPVAADRPFVPTRGYVGRLRFLSRLRFQVLGGVLFAVALPVLLGRAAILPTLNWPLLDPGEHTLLGTLMAVVIGAYALRRVTAYPGARSIAFVLPVISTAYLIVILGFFFLRLDYSRSQLLFSFGAAILWFLFTTWVQTRSFRPRFLVLPFGSIDRLVGIGSADLVLADKTRRDFSRFGAIVADLRADMPDDWQRMIAAAALSGVPVYHVKQLTEALTGRVEIEHPSENNLGSLLPSSLYLRFKRVADVAATIASLPLTLPILGVAALAILLLDGRPVLFRQERMGYRGRIFTVVKLRTMRAKPGPGAAYTIDNDPRVTSLGRILRKLRIDELPQIWNILRGEMSWIGPRPEALPLSRHYEAQIPFYPYRHIVRPGISGWAAVNQGNVAEVEHATTKLQYDFYYIRHFGLWLDLLIVAKTVHTVITGFGSK